MPTINDEPTTDAPVWKNPSQFTQEELMQQRYHALSAKTMMQLALSMNQMGRLLGTCVYFGRNEVLTDDGLIDVDPNYPFVAIFDGAAQLVVTMEDMHDLATSEGESQEFDFTPEEYKQPSSA